VTSEFDATYLNGEADVESPTFGLLEDDPGGVPRKEEWEVAGLEHEPVLRADVVRLLLPRPRPGLRLVDCTTGLGGHAEALLEAAPPDAELLGLDRDPIALEKSARRLARFGDRVRLVQSRFSGLGAALAENGWESADAILVDLGVSSMQLDDGSRGFSFRSDADLDMRMDPTRGTTAADLLVELDEGELAQLLREKGEEPAARRIARAIKRAESPPRTTAELRALIQRVAGGRGRRHDPATLTFQALRLAVNEEMEELDRLLADLPDCLSPGSRVAVLAYHSLEDRRVKRSFAAWSRNCVCPPALAICRCGGQARAAAVVRRAIVAGEEEVSTNPRARSARLRVVEWSSQSGGGV
jgi:16S rRNA (cytosine1402-N4)-methyltransferase